MKKLSLIWVALLVYPVIMTSVIMKNACVPGIASVIFSIAVSVVPVFAGGFTRFLFYKKERRRGSKVFIAETIAGLVLCGLISVLVSGGINFAAVYAFVLFFIGLRLYDRSITETVNSAYVLISSLLYFFTAVGINKYMKSGEVFTCFIIPYIIMMFIWFVLHNSVNMSRMMTTRNYDEKYLPEGIKKYNLFLSGAVCVLSAAVLLSYKKVAEFFRMVVKGISKVVIRILSAGSGDISEEIEEEIEQAAEKSEEVIYSSGNSEIFQILCIIFLLAVAAAFLIYAYKTGILSGMARSIVASFRKIFSRGEVKESEKASLGFTDVFEDITEEERTRDSSLSKKIREWKTRYRKYTDMPEGCEKLRAGYGLTADWIRIVDPSVKLSDTPCEISEKIKNSSLDESTEAYCRIRYGDEEFNSEGMKKIEKTLSECRKEIR